MPRVQRGYHVSGFDCSRAAGSPNLVVTTMPKIRTTRTKKPPEGYEDIEGVRTDGILHSVPEISKYFQILDDYAKKMRDAENESHEGKRKTESLWPIFQLNHARSRYIYELYYKRQAISKALYDWLLQQGYADAK